MATIRWKTRALLAEEFAYNLAQGRHQDRRKMLDELADDVQNKFSCVSIIADFIRNWKGKQ